MKRGFTLIEILVVITIIGVLATVGTGSYSTLTANSRDARRKADLEEIRAALEMYKSNNGSYPDTDSIAPGNIIGDTSPGTNIYLQKVPDDPKPSTYKYHYVKVSNSNYTLGAFLENGSGSNCATNSCGGNTIDCNYCLSPYGQK